MTLYCNNDSTRQDNVTVFLSQAEMLLSSICYNKSRANCIFAFGLAGNRDGRCTKPVITSLIQTELCNVFLLDWEQEASAIQIIEVLDPITKALSFVLTGIAEALNVGFQLGLKLVEWGKRGVDLLKAFLIGHSLGAQLMGIAGGTVRRLSDLIVRWIFGLDPAGPFYDYLPITTQRLSAYDGEAVFCIHTDPGDYGTNKSVCTVDYLMNFLNHTLPDKKDNVQPGCPKGDFPKFSINDSCSHDRACLYFAEAMKNPLSLLNFLACKANTVYDFERRLGDCSNNLSISLYWDYTKKRGDYYTNTNDASPFDLGRNGCYC